MIEHELASEMIETFPSPTAPADPNEVKNSLA